MSAEERIIILRRLITIQIGLTAQIKIITRSADQLNREELENLLSQLSQTLDLSLNYEWAEQYQNSGLEAEGAPKPM